MYVCVSMHIKITVCLSMYQSLTIIIRKFLFLLDNLNSFYIENYTICLIYFKFIDGARVEKTKYVQYFNLNIFKIIRSCIRIKVFLKVMIMQSTFFYTSVILLILIIRKELNLSKHIGAHIILGALSHILVLGSLTVIVCVCVSGGGVLTIK